MNAVKLVSLLGLSILSKVDGFTQSSSAAVTPASAPMATVYFYQSTPPTWLQIKYRLYDQDKLIGKLSRHTHRLVQLPAGTHTFATKIGYPWFGPKPSLTLTLEAGKTYYIQGDEKLAFWPPQAILSLTEVVPNAVKLREINNSREDEPITVSSLD
ncbi:hypothetical protein GO755_24660 [Spirosoma sp. HMF4905]|uniref:DUF2846 domain-containing protein n=1 Tax=Spirosoma arboris TaxID=2682092 RepID=A0A7K1SHL3_9BACT|nr:hypothetical protein [Spirosoma arboris]MVM33255.1 hypothetical protein [Spirosoma arboris]